MSYNELFEIGSHSTGVNLQNWFPCQDDTTNKIVVDQSTLGTDGTLSTNSANVSITGPNSYLTRAFDNGIFGMDSGDIFNPGSSDFSVLYRMRSEGDAFQRQILNASFSDASDILSAMTSNGTVAWRFVRPGGGPSNAAQVLSGSGYDDTSWHDVACIRNSGTMYLYIDGTSVGSTDLTGTWNFSTVTGAIPHVPTDRKELHQRIVVSVPPHCTNCM